MKTKNYLSKVAKNIIPYQWEEADEKWLRFDTNTLPFAPKSLTRFLNEMKSSCTINEYSDPTYKKLKDLISLYEKVPLDKITVTNSGDEAIDILIKTFLNPKELIIITPPTYEMFSIQCKINGGEVLEIPLSREKFEVNAKEIINAAKNEKVKIIFLVNPNNPTGSIIPQKLIEDIVKNSDAIVVVDEAYREFYGKTSVALLKKYNNLVILRSFSKFAGLAGARIGYLLASKELSEKFDAIRFPMGVSFLSYKLAETVMQYDKNWMKDQVKMIRKERERLVKEFSKIGYKVYPSCANFVLVNFGSLAKKIYKKLKEKGIVVRDRSGMKYLEGCLRITVRSPKENEELIKVLKEISNKDKYAFLDRDGTLIFEPQDTFQIDSLNKLKILDGVIEGLKKLKNLGFKFVMISNQDGLGTKSFPTKDFNEPQNKMLGFFKENGITFEKIFICPHLPSENCKCRKPKIGLVGNFFKDNNIDKEKSFVCGDRKSDKNFAKNIGINFIPMQTNKNFYNSLKKGGIFYES